MGLSAVSAAGAATPPATGAGTGASGVPTPDEDGLPRRAPRPRKLSSRVRSPSPTPVTPIAKAPRARAEPSAGATPAAHSAHTTPAAAAASPAAPAPRAAATPSARTPRTKSPTTPATLPVTPANTAADASLSPEEETGPGKRHRRPSTMYRPPEALTSEHKKAPSPPAPASASRAKNGARNKSPGLTVRLARRSEDRAPAPPAEPASAAPAPTPVEQTPATFTRHGERIIPPPRRTVEVSRRADMSGILSPKPVRTASGVWRPLPPMPLEDEDEEEEDDDDDVGSDVVQRSADIARQAWSIAVLGAQPKPNVHSVVLASEAAPAWPPSSAPSNESDGEEDDFHKTMLHDPELDLLTHVPSPSHDGSDASDGVLTDGNVTTPASCAKEGSPGDVAPTRSPSAKLPASEAGSDAVFQHALPLPRSTEAHAHAGSLTLSLPYELCPAPSAAATPPAADGELDADGDTPLTPVHSVTAQERAERASLGARGASPAETLAALLPDTLPSADAPAAPDAPSSPFSPASPLFDDASPSTSDSAPTDATLHLSLSAEPHEEDDAYFASPDEIMALTDLDHAWDSAHLRDDAPRTPHGKRRRCAPEAKCAPAPRRMPRLRSRAS